MPAWAAVAILVVVTCVGYLPALNGGFILDDDLLLHNTLIKAPDGLYRMWFTGEPIDYWPLSNSTLWVEWRLWGDDPRGYHVANLVLHIATSLLLWRVLRQLAIPGAYLAALLFALHPVNVDSVAWISQRKTIMAMLFFLLSIHWYLRADPGPRRWYWLSLLAFLLGMLSKGSVGTLPLVLLLIAWWQRDRITVKDLARSAPFFLIAVPLIVVNMLFQDHYSHEPIRTVSFAVRLLGAGAIPWFYLYKALLPVNLCFVYPLWEIDAGNVLWWLPLLASVAATGVLWWQRHTGWGRPLLFAWGFFWLALVPVLGFADVSYMKWSLVADHYQYVALPAVTALIAASLVRMKTWLPPAAWWVGGALAVVLAGIYLLLTLQVSATYRNEITIYRATLAQNPTSAIAYNNLAALFLNKGRPEEAIEPSQRALELRPNQADAHMNLGKALAQTGRPLEAIQSFERAVAIQPNLLEARNNIGAILLAQNQLAQAAEQYTQALEIKPDDAVAHNSLGIALYGTGQTADAIEHFQRAVSLRPDFAPWQYNLGQALFHAGRVEESCRPLQQSLQLQADYPNADHLLGMSFVKLGRNPEALPHLTRAADLTPENADLRDMLASLLFNSGQPQQAVEHFAAVARLRPERPESHNNLAAALLLAGRPQPAVEHFQRAVQLKPDYAEAWTSLTAAYAQTQQRTEAIDAAEKAIRLARSQGNAALAQQMEAWLSAYREGSSKPNGSQPAAPALPPSQL